MPISRPARYKRRKIRDWLIMAENGKIALPTFQRSYVWGNQRIADYLKALFENRPTGIFLILKTNGSPQFESRTLKGLDGNGANVQELVLDGQQRLTSLRKALHGTPSSRFYIEVEDLIRLNMKVKRVTWFSDKSGEGRSLLSPRTAYERNHMPLDILWDDQEIDDLGKEENAYKLGKIWKWCNDACGGSDASTVRYLETAIEESLCNLFLERKLYYCALPNETERNVAIEVFVETNKSSATIKRFDIVVALAQGDYREDIRNRIADFRTQNPVTTHYFSKDEEEAIPEIGEWILKVACLKISSEKFPSGAPPRESNYEVALESLFQEGEKSGPERLNALQGDLVAALETVARHGGATREMLASWPPVHVIAALQDEIRMIKDPRKESTTNTLISVYLWRTILTDRYEAQANDRLFEDFKALRDCLTKLRETGNFGNLPLIFDNEEYPVPTCEELIKMLPWIGRKSRLGRGIAGIIMKQTPQDWVTGNPLDVNTVRGLEGRGELNRHHVFPKAFLKESVLKEKVDHGLNGVLLSGGSNRVLSSMDPKEYLQKLLKDTQSLDEKELRKRVESHLVPYDALMSEGTPKNRYECFIKERATLMAEKIEELTSL